MQYELELRRLSNWRDNGIQIECIRWGCSRHQAMGCLVSFCFRIGA